MMQHIDHISFRPYTSVSAVLAEESVVAVFAFGDVPFVEILAHHHEAHFVAEFDEFLCRHVVRGADCVASHILQNRELTTDGGFVYCGSERTEVVMKADSAELTAFAVEEESFFRNNPDASESESGPFCVLQLSTVCDGDSRPVHIPVGVNGAAQINLSACLIQVRILWRP